MKQFQKILVATDTRLADHPIVTGAAEIARHNRASLTIVDVVPEFAWAVRLSLKDHKHVRRLIALEKEENLQALAAPIRESGIDVETRVLLGKTSIEIIREVLRGGHDVVLRIAKGKDSRRAGFFGNTGIRLLRKCPCPVWLVTPDTTPSFKHVLGCVDTSTDDELDQELNDQVFQLASSISKYHNGRYSIIHVWSVYGEQMIKGRMKPKEFDKLETDTHDHAARLLEKFLRKHGGSARAENMHLEKGEPPDVIPEFVRQNGVELVVMGTVARSGLAGAIMGNTAEQILNGITCSVLAVKPASFVCPVQLDD